MLSKNETPIFIWHDHRRIFDTHEIEFIETFSKYNKIIIFNNAKIKENENLKVFKVNPNWDSPKPCIELYKSEIHNVLTKWDIK